MRCRAKGQLAHHFWGNYHASVALIFSTPAERNTALSSGMLGGGWKPSEKREDAVLWHGDSDALKGMKERMGELGADVSKIDSIRFSIDRGEPFEIDFEATDPGQLSLEV